MDGLGLSITTSEPCSDLHVYANGSEFTLSVFTLGCVRTQLGVENGTVFERSRLGRPLSARSRSLPSNLALPSCLAAFPKLVEHQLQEI